MNARTPTSLPSAKTTKRKRIKLNMTNVSMVIWFTVFFVALSAISFNVFVLTIMGIHTHSNTNIADIAKQVHIKESMLPAIRGQILDRSGAVIAEDVTTYKIIAYLSSTRVGLNNQPAYVVDKEATAKALAPILNTSESSLLDLLSRNLFQTELGTAGRNLTLSQKQVIEALNLPGLSFEMTQSRHYPLGVFASHMIGIAQFDQNLRMIDGKTGIELTLNPFLRGINGSVRYQSDSAGFIYKDMLYEETLPTHGANVITTIDRGIQETLELSLTQTMQEHNASMAFAMVMNIQTAEILGYGHTPSFDPNKLNIDSYVDINAQSNIEPGSVMKTLLWASVIEQGLYNTEVKTPSKIFYMGIANGLPTWLPTSQGSYANISNFNRVDHGLVDFNRAFELSLNTTVGVLLSDYIRPSTYIATLEQLSLFKNLNIYGLRSVNGQLIARYPIEMITLGFGQGSSVVPLNMLSAYQALLNQGQHIQPSIIKQVAEPATGQVVYAHTPTYLNQVFSPSTTAQMIELLRGAVVNGTGRFYQIEEANIIGKTGTSQLPSPTGGYKTDEYTYSFIAALPYENPQYLMYYAFTAKDAKGAHQRVDAQKALLRKIAVSMNVSQEQSSTETTIIHVPSFVNQSVARFNAFAIENKLKTLVLGEGNQITHLSIAPNSKVLSSSLILAQTNAPLTTMPYVIGLSVNEAKHLARFASLDMEIIGEGIIVASNIDFNQPIDQKIILTAKKP
jgi:penicillin-binding protein 2B